VDWDLGRQKKLNDPFAIVVEVVQPVAVSLSHFRSSNNLPISLGAGGNEPVDTDRDTSVFIVMHLGIPPMTKCKPINGFLTSSRLV
jgi:hypothetical protein